MTVNFKSDSAVQFGIRYLINEMGINWEKSLKQYLVKKFKEELGYDIEVGDIANIDMDFDLDYSKLAIRDLSMLYSLSITTEKFEATHKILEELKKRNCTVKLNIDEKDISAEEVANTPKDEVDEVEPGDVVEGHGVDDLATGWSSASGLLVVPTQLSVCQ